jgi:phage-related protein
MPSVGAGVVEIRIHTRLEHRVMYVVAVQGEVHVLHAFEKKTQKTRDADLDLARVRLRAVRAAAASRKP